MHDDQREALVASERTGAVATATPYPYDSPESPEFAPRLVWLVSLFSRSDSERDLILAEHWRFREAIYEGSNPDWLLDHWRYSSRDIATGWPAVVFSMLVCRYGQRHPFLPLMVLVACVPVALIWRGLKTLGTHAMRSLQKRKGSDHA